MRVAPRALLLVLALGLAPTTQGGSDDPQAPKGACIVPKFKEKAFHVIENMGWFTTDCGDVTGGADGKGGAYGTITKAFWSLRLALTWSVAPSAVGAPEGGSEAYPVAISVKSMFSWGREYYVYDCHEATLAVIHEKSWGMFSSEERFNIYAADGKTLAAVSHLPYGWFKDPEIHVTSPDGKRKLASVKRPLLSWGDDWTIEILDPASSELEKLGQDPRVLIMMMGMTSQDKGHHEEAPAETLTQTRVQAGADAVVSEH